MGERRAAIPAIVRFDAVTVSIRGGTEEGTGAMATANSALGRYDRVLTAAGGRLGFRPRHPCRAWRSRKFVLDAARATPTTALLGRQCPGAIEAKHPNADRTQSAPTHRAYCPLGQRAELANARWLAVFSPMSRDKEFNVDHVVFIKGSSPSKQRVAEPVQSVAEYKANTSTANSFFPGWEGDSAA